MTRNLETDPKYPTWYNNLMNSWFFCLPGELCWTLFMLSFGFKEKAYPDNPWRYIALRAQVGGRDLFWNSILSVSVGFPFCVAVQVRWSVTTCLQIIIGWKPNGRFTLVRRVQTDAQAATGVSAPNPGEATGWVGGVK